MIHIIFQKISKHSFTVFIQNLKYIYLPFDNCQYHLRSKVKNLHSTDNGEPSKEAHGATDSRQHVHKLCSSVLCDPVKCWGVEIYSHKSQIWAPLIL